MIPTVFIGLFFEEEIASLFGGQILLVGCMLLITALLLLLADKAKDTTKNVTFKNAIVVGISQAIAILPGISRSIRNRQNKSCKIFIFNGGSFNCW